jgi:hypothetical protein
MDAATLAEAVDASIRRILTTSSAAPISCNSASELAVFDTPPELLELYCALPAGVHEGDGSVSCTAASGRMCVPAACPADTATVVHEWGTSSASAEDMKDTECSSSQPQSSALIVGLNHHCVVIVVRRYVMHT